VAPVREFELDACGAGGGFCARHHLPIAAHHREPPRERVAVAERLVDPVERGEPVPHPSDSPSGSDGVSPADTLAKSSASSPQRAPRHRVEPRRHARQHVAPPLNARGLSPVEPPAQDVEHPPRARAARPRAGPGLRPLPPIPPSRPRGPARFSTPVPDRAVGKLYAPAVSAKAAQRAAAGRQEVEPLQRLR
jgi:hypothetical protein